MSTGLSTKLSWSSSSSKASRRLLAGVGDENILCEYHLRTQRAPVRGFDIYLQVKCSVKIALIRCCISRKFEYVGDPLHMRRAPTGTDLLTLSVATDYVAVRSAGYENILTHILHHLIIGNQQKNLNLVFVCKSIIRDNNYYTSLQSWQDAFRTSVDINTVDKLGLTVEFLV